MEQILPAVYIALLQAEALTKEQSIVIKTSLLSMSRVRICPTDLSLL